MPHFHVREDVWGKTKPLQLEFFVVVVVDTGELWVLHWLVGSLGREAFCSFYSSHCQDSEWDVKPGGQCEHVRTCSNHLACDYMCVSYLESPSNASKSANAHYVCKLNAEIHAKLIHNFTGICLLVGPILDIGMVSDHNTSHTQHAKGCMHGEISWWSSSFLSF